MFYLIEFFKSLNEYFFRGLIFFILTCSLSFFLSHRVILSKTINKISPEKLVNPYFVVVSNDDINENNFKRAIQELPGVIAIDDKNNEVSKNRISALINELGSEYQVNSDFLKIKSSRVILNPSLSQDSLEFIREQVVKIGGKEKITATEIKYPEVTKVMNAHPFYTYLKKIGDWGIISMFAVLWITSYWLCYDIFRSRAYIVEKYQRRKYVAAKTLAFGLGLIFLIFSILSILNGTFKLLDLILLFMILSVFWTFSMQEWKWKNAI